ncbi:hypothetical protein NIE88_18645 [Sporolactobacillus shoreicorticis]|uniref:Phage protein n=1 Tax=Sporolactobacillus shoreicorticis TaxID=1923877 RepID=A0ABW5S8V1_9BACL|nr:hypothetical protein [Sporolactobacillus shoreicorticis]MCO7127768.1 hypothetical protein [Sporolactobacillus shoreicorticis]
MSTVETVADAIVEYGHRTGISMRKLAKEEHFDHSIISKAKHNQARIPDYLEPALSQRDWGMCYAIVQKQSGNRILNAFSLIRKLDMSKPGLKELLFTNMQEAIEALKNFKAYKRNSKQEVMEPLYEIYDVIMYGMAAFAVYEDSAGIDHNEFLEGYKEHVEEEQR